MTTTLSRLSLVVLTALMLSTSFASAGGSNGNKADMPSPILWPASKGRSQFGKVTK
jgi:hypothetical protein